MNYGRENGSFWFAGFLVELGWITFRGGGAHSIVVS